MSKNNKIVRLQQTNNTGKKVGADAKACWEGYKYAGTKNGKDICVPQKKK